MAVSNLKSLIAKLNEPCRNALESAAGLCLSQTHYEVDIEHFLLKLLELSDTDVLKILKYFEVNEAHVAADLTRTMEKFKTGNARTPALSPRLPKMIQEAWMAASVDYQSPRVRSGHILLALLDNDELSRIVLSSSEAFKKISVETLKKSFQDLVSGSAEDVGGPRDAGVPGAAKAGPAGTKALDQFTINLTERARKGEIDPVLGRDKEIRQMVDILIRRRQNNPILTGEAGVGKTAVVEGFALRIALGDVPPILQNVEVRTLDLGLLQAGAGIKGEFENRLKGVINEVKASPVPIILFIDEAHTLIGAGGQAGSGDAANLLKPALARGELRTIAATTWAEYKKYFEKDAAMARRFQVVKIEEPDEEKALVMMRAIAPFLEKHHKVMITDQALLNTVRLSHRYISGRQLPDKAVSVLDTACARVAIGLTTSPPAVEEAQRRIGQIEREIKILTRETAIGQDHGKRLEALEKAKADTQARLDQLNQKWQSEMEAAVQVKKLHEEIQAMHEKSEGAGEELTAMQAQLKELEAELAHRQAGDPLVQIAVEAETVSAVVSGWTGIPTGRMLTNEIDMVLNLGQRLKERIIGQDHGLQAISQVIQTAHAGIEDPAKPTGVFMLVGPSGVGKTETALALSELLYGGEQNMITINMSEYQEAHTVSSLKGSPPGYVGYGEGGVLTEAVRRRPYSVVLLDEIEKAHTDVTELFFQVFDKGTMEDGEGRRIDFKNTLIILTSNLGTDLIMKLCADEETAPDPQGLAEMVKPELLKHFKPAFLGRLKVVPYYPITDNNMKLIIRLKLNRIVKRMRENREIDFIYDENVVEAIAGRCKDVDSGARNADHIMTNTLLPQMSRELLSRMAAGEEIKTIQVSMDGDGFSYEIR
ncbi:MAG: type VI secretion system ATPase TssH [Desulfobacteraceae bacterium]|nr:MAG: type VI secretion system ATPase TssH [Desulfobacteraceae bacterium]